MVQFAVQRKFTKNNSVSKSSVSASSIWKLTWSYIRRIPVMYFRSFLVILLLFYWWFLALKYTIFVPEYRISKIDYALSSVKNYDDPYLYKAISSIIKWENIYILNWNNSSIIKNIKKSYPFVEDIIISYKAPKTVFVKILFLQPDLIFLNDNKRYWVYNNSLFELYSWNTLGSSWVVKLNIISFTSWSAISWVFFQESTEGLLEDIRLIKEWFPNIASLSYIPWWHRMIAYLGDDKKVYINNAIDIQPQIINYQLLKKYYSDFWSLKEIDLWSLESDKVIVRK